MGEKENSEWGDLAFCQPSFLKLLHGAPDFTIIQIWMSRGCISLAIITNYCFNVTSEKSPLPPPRIKAPSCPRNVAHIRPNAIYFSKSDASRPSGLVEPSNV